MNKQILFSMISVLLVALLLVGCTQSPQATEENEEAPEQNNDEAAKIEAKADTKVEAKVDVTAGKSLKELLSGKGTKYTADYTMTSPQANSQFTLVQDLPKLAYHMKMEQGESKTILDGDMIYSCTNMAGSWMCYKMQTNTLLASEQLEKDVETNKVNPVYKGACNIAGETGSSYEIINQDSEATVCYTADGILLEMTTSKPIQSSLKATSIKRSVDASAFVLPAAAQDMPSFPGMPQ
ncbi:hypothetical protein HYV86_03500 [Candidatus Woesearchaeota archaeon]|nr:hypothetical protein [Candidatus Woesearchaeota archaeon]